MDHPLPATTVCELTVFLVEDSPAIRARVAAMLGEVPDVRLIGAADRVREAIDRIETTQPDALVLDLQIPGGSGLDVLRAVRGSQPGLRVAVLTNLVNDQYRRACVAAGAEQFLDKSEQFDRIPALLAAWAREKRANG